MQACSVKCISRDTGIVDCNMLFLLLTAKNFLLYTVFDEISDMQFDYLKQRKRQSIVRRESRSLETSGVLNRTSIALTKEERSGRLMSFGKKKKAIVEKIDKVNNFDSEDERKKLGISTSIYVTGGETGQGPDIEEKGKPLISINQS